MSAGGGKGRPIYTSDSFRRAVDAMCEEWDEWAAENQGTRECFESALRKALAQIEQHPDPVRAALVEALGSARDYITSELSRERDTFKGHENCSDIPAIERDLAQTDAALKAAGEVL